MKREEYFFKYKRQAKNLNNCPKCMFNDIWVDIDETVSTYCTLDKGFTYNYQGCKRFVINRKLIKYGGK